MKSLKYTTGIIFGLFLTIACKQGFYRIYDLQNSVTMFYAHQIKDLPRGRCALLCLSTEGCSCFYWYNKSCYILNAASPGNTSVNIGYIYVHDELGDNCNLDGYDAIFGGILCVKVCDTEQNWADAKTTCEQDGGQLLVMRTSVFYLKLEALKTLSTFTTNDNYGIGGNDMDVENQFMWIDGSHVITEAWKTNSPNDYGGNEDCLELKNSKLDDYTCSNNRKFICEKSLI